MGPGAKLQRSPVPRGVRARALSIRGIVLWILLLILAANALPSATAGAAPSRVPTQSGRPRLPNPLAEQQWYYAQRAAPYGQIPAGAVLRAQQQAASIPVFTPHTAALRPNALGSGWTPIGPAPLNDATSTCATCPTGPFGPAGGRATALAYDPVGNGSGPILYVGGADGGLWASTNFSAANPTWTALTDTQPSLAVGAIGLDPGCPGTIYVGTGEDNFNGDAYYGVGILKSTDYGATWTLLPNSATIFGGQHDTHYGGVHISKIAVDPHSPASCSSRDVLVASDQGLWRSTDSGGTYTEVLGNPSFSASSITDLIVDSSTTPSTVYAAWGYIIGNNHNPRAVDNGIYKSTDGGATFPAPGSPTGTGYPTANSIGRIALAESAPGGTLYMTAADPDDSGNPGTNFSQSLGVWASTDHGATWVQITKGFASGGPDLFGDDLPPAFNGQQGWYDQWIAVDPANQANIYVGGVNIWKSTNGGCTTANCASFTDVTNVYTTNNFTVHPDEHAAIFVPNAPPPVAGGIVPAAPALADTLYSGNDGGVYSTANGATTWIDSNGDLGMLQFYAGSTVNNLQTATTPIIFGGMQDNGTGEYTGNPVWNEVFGGDGFYTANDNNNNPQNIYEEQFDLFISKSTDGGVTWNPAVNGIDPNDPVLFSAPFVMDPNLNTHLLAGTDRVYQTWDGANNWTPISPSLSPSGAISALAFAPRASNTTFYVGTSDGLIWRTTNDGATWTNITAGTVGTTGRYVSSLAVLPANPQDVVVTFSGFANPSGTGTGTHVYRSTNGGATWTDVSGNLPDSPLTSVVRNPLVANAFYVGGDTGFYVTMDGGATWMRYQTGLPNAGIDQVFSDSSFTTLVAATHGRGMATLPSDAVNVVTGCDVQAALRQGTTSLGVSASTQNFPAQYITFHYGGSVITARIPLDVTCPAFSVASSTITVTGVVSSASGTLFHMGDAVTVTLNFTPLSFIYGTSLPTSVTVDVTPGIGSSTVPFTTTLNSFAFGSTMTLQLY